MTISSLKYLKEIPSHIKIAFFSFFSRGIYLLYSLLSIRIITKILSIEAFSVFSILMNIVGWFLLADLGIGYSLQNYSSELKVKKKNVYNYILVALILLIIITFIIVFFTYILSDNISRFLFKNYSGNYKRAFFLSTLFGIFIGIGNVGFKILYSFQIGYLPNVLSALGAVLSYVVLKNTIDVSNFNLNYVCFVFFGSSFVITVIPFVVLFMYSIFSCNKRIIKKFFFSICKKILYRGFKFWGVSVMSAFVLQIDYLIMSQTLTSKEITLYSLSSRFYGLIFMGYTMLLSASWPSFTEWRVANEFEKIKFYTYKYILIGIVGILFFSILLYFKSDFLISLISNFPVQITTSLIILLAIYFMIRVWTDTFSIVLQSANILRPLWILTPIQALISIIMEYILSKYLGVNGILIALIVSFLVTVFWGLPYLVKKKLYF